MSNPKFLRRFVPHKPQIYMCNPGAAGAAADNPAGVIDPPLPVIVGRGLPV
jgi:hypothetical protein